MGIVVQKYGGSSVADVEKLGRVADKVVATRREGHDVVVVVSAMGKSTDQLLALAKQVDDTPPRRELDMLLSTGERVSMALLSMAIQKRGEPAISFTGSQSGLITNDRHFDARIIEVRPHRIEDELSRGKVVIVAGYQGMSYRREITTLGRGGSDTTAVALAAALGAERAEIYSDVDGVYTADPRVVEDARHLPALTYEQMQEMAAVGAKVLNAHAVEFARQAGIRIHARATFAPGRETIVQHEVPDTIRAVVGQSGVVRAWFADPGQLSEVLAVADAFALPVRDVQVHGGRASCVMATSLAPDWQAARARMEACAPSMTLESGLASASVVGVDQAVQVGAALAALTAAEVLPASIAQAGARLDALVAEAQVDRAVRALHARFVSDA